MKLVEDGTIDIDACAPLPESQRQGQASETGKVAAETDAMINNPPEKIHPLNEGVDGTGSDDGCS